MPLFCDCYPGCWAEHSRTWLRVFGDVDIIYKAAVRSLPHGCFVKMDDHVRVENREYLAPLTKPRITRVNPLGFWAVRYVTFGGADYVQVNWVKRSFGEALDSVQRAYFCGQVLVQK